MLTNPMDVHTRFPVRKTKKQKQAFRDAVQVFAEKMGYSCCEEAGSFGVRNLVIGDPKNAKYLVTAHYDTCARLPVPNWISPCNLFLFLLYQIFLTAIIILPPLLVGWLAGILLGQLYYGMLVGCLLIFVTIALMLVGPANQQNANDNTSGVIAVLEILRTMPHNQRDKVCFVLFDLEEAGLLGSAAYRKAHKTETNNQMVMNLDCVGDGDHLLMFPTRALKQNRKKLSSLYPICGYFGKKSLLVQEKGICIYPSDQRNFPYGVGICALRKGRLGLSMSRIHTSKDTILEETNINILRAALTTYICCDAVQKGKE